MEHLQLIEKNIHQNLFGRFNMAEFCYDCIRKNFGDVDLQKHDFYGICKKGEVAYVLCEGCGYRFVDHNGKINLAEDEES